MSRDNFVPPLLPASAAAVINVLKLMLRAYAVCDKVISMIGIMMNNVGTYRYHNAGICTTCDSECSRFDAALVFL